jgi:hypothetical protein
MGIYTDAVQKLYVAYFNRPADAAGLTYWEGVVAAAKGSTAAVSAAFAASDEYKAAYAGKDAYNVIAQVYQNLFGHAPDLAGLTFWGQGLLNKAFTVDTAVTEIAKGALGTDLVAYNNKVAAATAFTAALDTPAEVLGYSGNAANLAAKNWMAGITDNASLTAALANLDATVLSVTTPVPVAQSFTLTAGVDTILGGTGNDTIVANNAAGEVTLTTFDNVDGGAGVDTISFVDTDTASAAQFKITAGSVKNVEVVKVTTAGGVDLNTKAWTGVTDVTVSAAGDAAAKITVADTTNVTLVTATTSTTTVLGGKLVTVTAGDGDASVTGAKLVNVTVNGGADTTISNIDADGDATATMTNVTLNGVTGSAATLTGDALTNVSLKNIAQDDAVSIVNADDAHGLNLSVDAVGYDADGDEVAVSVDDATAVSVTIHANGDSNVAVTATAATTLTIDGAGALALDVAGLDSADFASIDASASTGGVTLAGIADTVTSITTGSGNDKLTVTAATVKDVATTTSVDETVSATVSTGAGNDDITIDASGNGLLTVVAGAGNDKVNVIQRTGTLNISMGDGNDTFTSAVAINGTDTIDAGAGSDTLALSLVGSANIGAFAGFDVFDAVGLGKTLDVDILATKNTVSEFIASGNVGAGIVTTATLLNIGAGVGVRVTGDMAGSTLAVTQKTGGALTVTVDADETGKGNIAADTRTASVDATNATSVKAVFDTSYVAKVTGEATVGDNVTTLNLNTVAATLDIVSGGTSSKNVLNFNDTNATDKLATINVSGTQQLTLTGTSTALATVDASASTGGLVMNTTTMKDGGKVILGSGVDTITVTAGGTLVESVQGFEKSGAIVVSVDVADATAKAAAIKDADTLVFGSADVTVANANAAVTTGTIAKGVLTFTGAGPATLADAISIANAAADADNEAVVFQYLGDSYAFVQGGAGTDIVVKLVGTVGVTQVAEVSADHFALI